MKQTFYLSMWTKLITTDIKLFLVARENAENAGIILLSVGNFFAKYMAMVRQLEFAGRAETIIRITQRSAVSFHETVNRKETVYVLQIVE